MRKRIYGFNAYLSTSQTIEFGGTGETLIYNTEVYDPEGMYNNSTGVITFPRTGIYELYASCRVASLGANKQFNIRVRKDGVDEVFIDTVYSTAAGEYPTVSGTVHIVVTDTADTYTVHATNNDSSNRDAYGDSLQMTRLQVRVIGENR